MRRLADVPLDQRFRVRPGRSRRRERIIGFDCEVEGPAVNVGVPILRRVDWMSRSVPFNDHPRVAQASLDCRTPSHRGDCSRDRLGRDVEPRRVLLLVDRPVVVLNIDRNDVTHLSVFAAADLVVSSVMTLTTVMPRPYPGNFFASPPDEPSKSGPGHSARCSVSQLVACLSPKPGHDAPYDLPLLLSGHLAGVPAVSAPCPEGRPNGVRNLFGDWSFTVQQPVDPIEDAVDAGRFRGGERRLDPPYSFWTEPSPDAW